MANVIIKSDERRAYEAGVLRSFGASNNAANREAAEVVAARTREAVSDLRRLEGRKR